MTARKGQLPWTGTAARTRDIGYANAMYDVWRLIREMQEAGILPVAALDLLASYAFDVYGLQDNPRVTLDRLGWYPAPCKFRETWQEMFGTDPGRGPSDRALPDQEAGR